MPRFPFPPALAGAALVVATGCAEVPAAQQQAGAPFGPGVAVGRLSSREMREVSGLVASARHPGHYWMHNDSGDEARIFAVDSVGRLVATVAIVGARNRDWEDIARRGDTLFIADIGDNAGVHPEFVVYTVMEPERLADTSLTPLARHRLRYPDGARDAEAFLVDPRTGDWFVVTKREDRVRVYRAGAPQTADSLVTLERIPGTLPFRRVVAGDVSPDGGEILLKTYERVFYWERLGDESLATTLFRAPTRLPYRQEPQGEAIGFTLDGAAYLTTTEREGGRGTQPLLRYPRLPTPPGPRAPAPRP